VDACARARTRVRGGPINTAQRWFIGATPPVADRGGADSAGGLGAGQHPRDCARAIHRAIDELETNAFVTAVIGFWDQHRAEFSWTNCGHLRPLLVRDEWVRELVADTTYPLGILGRERTFPSSTVPVRPGDRVFIYSDGIVEAPMGDGERFGLGRLKRLLVQTAGQPTTPRSCC
jgi:serine phosphatase RsbU (regulator of sigma subunit)